MRWFVYNVIFAIGYLALVPYYLFRMWRRGGYRQDFSQRLGFYSDALQAALREPRYWIHAVSVGEMLVALKFMEEFRAARPGAKFILSTTTSTGHALARKRLAAEDVLIYYPTDFPWVVDRVLRQMKVKGLILTEGKIWPNMVRRLRMMGIPVGVINGRLSDRSFRSFLRVRGFIAPILEQVDPLCMQASGDAERIVRIGARPDTVHVVGNTKYDVPQTRADDAERARAIFGSAGFAPDAVILLGGSTWAGEERILAEVYNALRRDHPALRLVLVPRHVERRASVAADVEAVGLKVLYRSRLKAGDGAGTGGGETVLMVDTTGELQSLYAGADLIFVGKSLTEHGGQNIIEPAQYGKPILVGPNMENFKAVLDDFKGAGAILQIADVAGLQAEVRRLLEDSAERKRMGERAGQVVAGRRGGICATVEHLQKAWKLA